MSMRVADVIVEILEQAGVKHCWGGRSPRGGGICVVNQKQQKLVQKTLRGWL